MRAWILASVSLGTATTLYACVGDDPIGGGPSGDGPDAASSSDTGASSSSGGDDSGTDTGADVDPDPGPHGDTLAQLEIKSPAFFGSIVPAPGGGAVIAWGHQGPAPDVGGKTPDISNGSAIVAKLDASLKASWWVNFQSGTKLAASPDGSVYWLAHMAEGGTPNSSTLAGSVGTNETFTIDGGGNGQGEEAGGAYIVVALNGDGTRRWTHVTALKSPVAQVDYIGHEGTFAASDKAVLFVASVKGTLEYTNSAGARVTTVCNNDYVIQEIDAASGRTREIIKIAKTAPYQRIVAGAGTTGYAGNGFVGLSEDWPANGSTPTKRYVALLDTQNGGAVSAWNKLESNLVDLDQFGSGVYQNIFPLGYASPKAAVSFVAGGGAPQTFTPPGAQNDAMFFLFDNVTPKVRGAVGFGGSGYDVARFVADARNGDIYGGGHYRSSDMSIAGAAFPPPPDNLTDQAFAVRLKLDAAQTKLVPVWARHFSGSARLAIWGGAADAITGDLYTFGWLSKGKAAFGLGDITSPGGGYDTTHWIVKIRR